MLKDADLTVKDVGNRLNVSVATLHGHIPATRAAITMGR